MPALRGRASNPPGPCSGKTGARVAGVILAAGASTRMGRTKQLLPWQGTTLLGGIVREACCSDLDRIVLVLGHKAEDIRKALSDVLENPKIEVIENPAYRLGISTSLKRGLDRIRDTHPHAMFLLGDMPFVDRHVINRLCRRYLSSRCLLGATRLGRKRSHPVIFNCRLYPELMQLQGDTGARRLFQKYRDQACLVDSEYNDRDIDTPADYEEAIRSHQKRE